jgi:hypothetical protein
VVTMFGRETTVTLSLGEIEKIVDWKHVGGIYPINH